MSGGIRGAGGDESSGPVQLELTEVDQARAPRADAVRNRAKLLEAASKLVAECGAGNLTMDAVAAAAQVGKGTVFRRFGDRNGLLVALLDHEERQLQEAFLFGPPPLGPGAPAVERLLAFGPAVLRHETARFDLYLAAEGPAERRFLVGAHRLRSQHVVVLLRAAGVDLDAELTAECLLARLDTPLVHHLTRQRGMPLRRLEDGWREEVRRLLLPML
ncbi:TetR/AcrR family transcriptional regulator [Saccharopolyspora griseoalba]|uniref:TetR/AcrR family transcriptional regulator n=1 Tax=Saccharopolyspora griseoalba TaxID=1431848 RepID=A0ABW2LGB3_9PSEU